MTSEGTEPHLVIWGTDVNVQDTKKKFKEFLETFVLEAAGGDVEGTSSVEPPLYMTRLDEVCEHWGVLCFLEMMGRNDFTY